MPKLLYLAHLLGSGLAVAWVLWFTARAQRPKWMLAVALVGLVALEAIAFKASNPPQAFYDFVIAYYPAGKAILHHDALALRNLTSISGGFTNLPIVAYAFAPLALLPAKLAGLALTALGLAACVGAWAALVRAADLDRRGAALLAILFLINGPLINGMKFGNLSYFLLLALAAGLLLLKQNRPAWAGVVLGVAAVIKPPFALFGFFFLLRRDWRALAGFAGLGFVTCALSLLLFGWSDNWHWFTECILQFSQGWMANFSVQSAAAFVYRLTAAPGILVDWQPHHPSTVQKLAVDLFTGALVLIALAASIGRPARYARGEAAPARRRGLQYALVICLSLLASPLSWYHYYVWMLVPVALFLGPERPRSTATKGIFWAAVALITPLALWPVTFANGLAMSFYKSIYVSHLLFGGVLWFGLAAWRLAVATGLVADAGDRDASVDGGPATVSAAPGLGA